MIIEQAQSILDRTDQIEGTISTLRARLSEVKEAANAVKRGDPLPVEFVGIIHNYRYSNRARGAGGQFVPATHKFEVECGAGLWLYVSCDGAAFDRLSATMPMPEFSDMAETLEDRIVCVVRDRTGNRFVPKEIIDGDPNYRDSRGQVLFLNARVMVEGRSGEGRVTRLFNNGNGDIASVDFGENSTDFYLETIVRL